MEFVLGAHESIHHETSWKQGGIRVHLPLPEAFYHSGWEKFFVCAAAKESGRMFVQQVEDK